MNKSIGSLGTLFDDPATVLLYRLYPGRPPHYLTRLNSSYLNLIWMYQRYGPGRYLVRVIHYGRVFRRTSRIMGARIITTQRWTVRLG